MTEPGRFPTYAELKECFRTGKVLTQFRGASEEQERWVEELAALGFCQLEPWHRPTYQSRESREVRGVRAIVSPPPEGPRVKPPVTPFTAEADMRDATFKTVRGVVPDPSAPGGLRTVVAIDQLPARLRQEGGDHYLGMPVQPFEFATRQGYDPGCFAMLKYLCRHRRKGGIEDVRKALHFLELHVDAEGCLPLRMNPRWQGSAMGEFIAVNKIGRHGIDAIALIRLHTYRVEGDPIGLAQVLAELVRRYESGAIPDPRLPEKRP